MSSNVFCRILLAVGVVSLVALAFYLSNRNVDESQGDLSGRSPGRSLGHSPEQATNRPLVHPLDEVNRHQPPIGRHGAVHVSTELMSEFSKLRLEAQASIPTQADLQKQTSEDVHFTPSVIIQAAIQIGKVAELIKSHPELSQSGLEFYKSCAENAVSPISIRASCNANYLRLAERRINSNPKDRFDALQESPQVSPHVSELTRQILR